MKNWGAAIARVVGGLNLVYGLLGMAMLVHELVRVTSRIHNSVAAPYQRAYYGCSTAANGLFLVGLVVAGYWLLRLYRRGAVLSNFVFSFEILYWVLSNVFSLAAMMSANRVIASIGLSMAGESGNMGIALQILTLYPLIALVGLNIARRRMDRDGSWKLATATPF
jgi:hypothetical protein